MKQLGVRSGQKSGEWGGQKSSVGRRKEAPRGGGQCGSITDSKEVWGVPSGGICIWLLPPYGLLSENKLVLM